MKDLKDMTVDELRELTIYYGLGIETFEEMAIRLSEAERKLSEAEERARHWEETCHSQHEDTVEPLRASLAEAEKDAGRYRWLKGNHLQTGPDTWIRTGDDLEEAIDAAIAAQNRDD